jgi:D-alanyl-D-alanine carboxypeptidase
MRRRSLTSVALVAAFVAVPVFSGAAAPASAATSCKRTFCSLTGAVNRIVATPDGPPGVIVVVQRGSVSTTVTAGVADLTTTQTITRGDEMRLASVSKAYSGATALALVRSGRLSLTDTIGKWLPSLPRTWSTITLRQLLNHTSRIPDFSKQKAFTDALQANLQNPPPPADLLTYVENLPLLPDHGANYSYSNSDNIIVGLMVAAAAGTSYESALASMVLTPLGLTQTSLPSDSTISPPFLHGYDVQPGSPPEDVSSLFAAGWTWASGAVVATASDTARFIRGYVSGRLFNKSTRSAQFTFVPGNSEPPGPGANAAGLALFRYSTPCGTVYGHTGNTAGYTQFAAATRDGSRSVVVSASAQITPTANAALFDQLRRVDQLAVCAALSGSPKT